jgi:2-amino-4-hydroxy-6-hydroxymethyldihydropteridine diphosphokinase
VAPVYRTEPVSPIPQPDYLNTVALGATREPPEALLELALGIERALGRVRGERGAPRPIDLDLLVVGGERRSGERLTLPHPRLRARRFVLAPLADLAPDLALPPDGAPVAALLAALPARPAVARLGALEELLRAVPAR